MNYMQRTQFKKETFSLLLQISLIIYIIFSTDFFFSHIIRSKQWEER